MKSRTLLISFLSIALIGATGWIYADAKKDRSKVAMIPRLRIGPGYVLYYMKDGSLRLPLSTVETELVTVWRLSKPDGTTIAEQPASRPESKSQGSQKPQPEPEGCPR